MNALRAELLKAVTTRLLLWLGLGLLAFLLLVLSIHIGSEDPGVLGELSRQRSTFAFGGIAAIVAVLVGAILLTAEYAHGTINQSFLAVPVRLRLLAAKLGGALLVLDEPANGLDPEGIRWLRNFLRSFADGGGTVFVSSHVLAEVSQLADEVVIIHRGKLVAHQPVVELIAQAAGAPRVRSPRAAALLERLRAAGIEAEADGDRLAVHAPPERVGDLAAEAGIPLHELVADTGSLEEAFLELTAEPQA